eukprot:481382-Pyramimonas_sp.AAC.1
MASAVVDVAMSPGPPGSPTRFGAPARQHGLRGAGKSPAVSATDVASVAPDSWPLFARARARWRGCSNAASTAKQSSQSPPHGFCKLNFGWVV